MDAHRNVQGLTADAVADAYKKDIEAQNKHGVRYHRYWYNEEAGVVFCLAGAPSKEAGQTVPQETYGLTADEIVKVKEGL